MPPVVPAVSKLTVRLPERFRMLPLLLNVPKTFIFVSDHVLAALVVSVPFVSTSTEPSIEKLVPETVTGALAPRLLPLTVAVLPDRVMVGLVPSRLRVPPAVKIPPPLLPAELLENVLVVIVVTSVLSRIIPPPLAVPSARLFETVEPLTFAEPVPPLKPKTSRPPPADAEFASLCEIVELVCDVNVPTQGQGRDTSPEP